MARNYDTADELAELTFAVVRYAARLTVLIVSALYLWAGSLLIRSFRSYYPHKSLTWWVLLTCSAISCNVVVLSLTHSVLAVGGLVVLFILAFGSLALIEHVLAGLARQEAEQHELPHSSPWWQQNKE